MKKKTIIIVVCLAAIAAGAFCLYRFQKKQQEIRFRNAAVISAYERGDITTAYRLARYMMPGDVEDLGIDYLQLVAGNEFYSAYQDAKDKEDEAKQDTIIGATLDGFRVVDYYESALSTWLSYKEELEQAPFYEDVYTISKEIMQTLVDDYQTNPLADFEEDRESGENYTSIDDEEFAEAITFLKELNPNIEEDVEDSKDAAYAEKNPFEFSDINCYRDGDYQRFEGTLSNISKTTHTYVEVKVTYYDSDGEMLTSDTTYAVGSDGLSGGGNQQFDMMTRVRGTVSTYKYQVISYQ